MKAIDLDYTLPLADENHSIDEATMKWMIQSQMETAIDAVILGKLQSVDLPFVTPEMVEDYLTEVKGWEEEYENDSNGWQHNFWYTWSLFQNEQVVKYTLEGSAHYGGLKFYLDK